MHGRLNNPEQFIIKNLKISKYFPLFIPPVIRQILRVDLNKKNLSIDR